MRIAIMQPYFAPYAGYFRLFAATDLFVILDDAQHIRRGYVHRNKLLNRNGNPKWLTLPLRPCPQETLIKDLKWHPYVNELWNSQLKKFPKFDNNSYELPSISPTQFIVRVLEIMCELLNIPFNVSYSSGLNLDPNLRGQDRILAICNHFETTEYVNSPGGKELYNEDAFRLYGIKLKFLPEWKGSYLSILQHLEEPNLREQICSQL